MSINSIVCPACGIDLEPVAPIPPGGGDDDGPSCPACGNGSLFRVEPAGPVRVMHLQGRGLVTEQNVMRSLERVRYMIGDGTDRARVLIDFDGINYLSSTILARLINLARLAKEAGAVLKLCRLRPDIQDIFRITRLEGFFDRHPDLESALLDF